MDSKASQSHILPQIIYVSPQGCKSQLNSMKKRCDRVTGGLGLCPLIFNSQIFRFSSFQGYFLRHGLIKFSVCSLDPQTSQTRSNI